MSFLVASVIYGTITRDVEQRLSVQTLTPNPEVNVFLTLTWLSFHIQKGDPQLGSRGE